MAEPNNQISLRQTKRLSALSDSPLFDGHAHGVLERYGTSVERFADRINNSENPVLERIILLTDVFERRKSAILKFIRSTQTINIASATVADIKLGIQRYEEWAKIQNGVDIYLNDYFQSGKTEVVLADGLYHIVPDKESFLEILADSIHDDLFGQTEFFKNVSGVLATRLDEQGKTEVLLVRSAKTGIWQFPGGKAEHVCTDPDTGRVEIVAEKGGDWQFADGRVAPRGHVRFETPEECLRREISEELGEDVGSVTLGSSGFYTIGSSRFLIHGFVANNLSVDPKKVRPAEIDRIMWTSDPFGERGSDGVTPIAFTDQTKDILSRFFERI